MFSTFDTQSENIAIPLAQEKRIETSSSALHIGVPREIDLHENRVALTPSGVKQLVNLGFMVSVASTAGDESHFSDEQYAESGASICTSNKEVYQSDIILKVASPQLDEMRQIKEKALVFSFLGAIAYDRTLVRTAMNRKLTLLIYDQIRDYENTLIIVRLMSEIAGRSLVGFVSSLLACPKRGKGRSISGFAGIPSAKVVVFGAGILAKYFIEPLLMMGVEVDLFDSSLTRLRRFQQQISTPIRTHLRDQESMKFAVESADIVVSALPISDLEKGFQVPQDWLDSMEQGSVIIDLNIDRGGSFENIRETTLSNPMYVYRGLQYLALPNFTSAVPNSASMALNNYLIGVMEQISRLGDIEHLLLTNRGLRYAAPIYKGFVTDLKLSSELQFIHKDIDLLLALTSKV